MADCHTKQKLIFSCMLSPARLSARLSVCLSVCLSSVVRNVRAPYTQAIEIFGNVSTPFGAFAICDLSIKILRRSSQGNPFVGGVKHKRGSRI